MQPGTQQTPQESQGFYRPTKPTPYPKQPDDRAVPGVPAYDQDAEVSWQASEYIHRTKDVWWVLGFVAVTIILLGVAVWFQAWTFAALVVAMAISMGYFAFRPPKVKQYTLSHHGLKIDDRFYHFSHFRSFGVLAEEAFFSVVLVPVKRFMPAVTVYFAQEDGEKIVDILGAHLPLENMQPDPIDAFMRRLHF